MNLLKHLLTAAFVLLLIPAIAQKPTITGKITDKAGNPIADVSVLIKGTSTGTSSDQSGNFSGYFDDLPEVRARDS